jgi:uncharacterized membrane protein YfcA
MDILQIILLFAAAAIAGALNSVAGGGSFISFPMLVATGIPSIQANATNTVALWPGSAASVGAYRDELNTQRRVLVPLCTISVIGGLLGAIVLLNTPAATFDKLIPFLLAFATLVFAFSGRISRWIRERSGGKQDQQNGQAEQEISLELKDGGPSLFTLVGVCLLQLIVATYGGFFGAGIGIMMLAVLSLMGMENIHKMNALKTLLATFINGVATLSFILAGKVYWPQALLMIVGSILGGYYGAYYAKKVDPVLVRRFVIVVGCVLTVFFFIRAR